MKNIIFLGGLSLMVLLSCNSKPSEPDFTSEGLKPIYLQIEDYDQISQIAPIPFERVGKIYKQGSNIFISDKGKGVHIINNMNPANPEKITFLEIPGNFDMATRGSYLYADNFTDLVTLHIGNLQEVTVIDRILNVYPEINSLDYPQFHSGYFECVDDSKGLVVDWEEATLTNPKCSR